MISDMISEFANAFPGLFQAAKIADFVAGFVIDSIKLVIWLMILPVLIVIWCFYHPALAHVYATNAFPLLWGTNSATRCLLGLFALLVLLPFKKTHKFAKYTLITLFWVGIAAYIIAIF